jgi:predicted secreted Zn-dependent protease
MKATRTHRTRRAKRRQDEAPEQGMAESDRTPHPLAALQRTHGNAAIERALAQRYSVQVPRDAGCDEVTAWIDANNPYVPNMAMTTASFTWGGGFRITGSAPDFTLSVSNPRVRMSGPTVDMPEWNPSNRAMRTAWRDMYARLRRHEGEHEAIARRWHTTLRERLAALSIPVSATSRDEVSSQANDLINAEWNAWIAEYQTDMTAIDPHTEELHCPVAEAEAPDGGDGGEEAA